MSKESLILYELESKENLIKDTVNLKEVTEGIIKKHKRKFTQEIQYDNNKYYDSMHLKFLQDNINMTFDDIQLVKKVFDFLKEQG